MQILRRTSALIPALRLQLVTLHRHTCHNILEWLWILLHPTYSRLRPSVLPSMPSVLVSPSAFQFSYILTLGVGVMSKTDSWRNSQASHRTFFSPFSSVGRTTLRLWSCLFGFHQLLDRWDYHQDVPIDTLAILLDRLQGVCPLFLEELRCCINHKGLGNLWTFVGVVSTRISLPSLLLELTRQFG